MNREERKAFFDAFEEDVLYDLAEEFREKAALLERNFQDFTAVVNELATSMQTALCERLGVPTLEAIEQESRNVAFSQFVIHLNDALPATHPYCLAVVAHILPVCGVACTAGTFPRTMFPAFCASNDMHDTPYVLVEDEPNLFGNLSAN